MKNILLILLILIGICAFSSNALAVDCDSWQNSCSKVCIIWLQDKRVGYAPHYANVGGACFNAINVGGNCAASYNIDWMGECIDRVGDVGIRVDTNCQPV